MRAFLYFIGLNAILVFANQNYLVLDHAVADDGSSNKLLDIELSTEVMSDVPSPFSSTINNFDQNTSKYMNYKTAYGLKFDPSVLQGAAGQAITRLDTQMTTIDPRLDFSVQHVAKKKSGAAAALKKRRKGPKKKKLFNIRNPLTVVTNSDKPLNDTLRVKKLEKYHKVLGSLKKSVKRLKRLTRDNSTKVVPDKVSARWLNVLDIVEYETKPYCLSSPRPLTGLTGQCYSEKKCAQLGGMAFDYCAYGYGVCCICKLLLELLFWGLE